MIHILLDQYTKVHCIKLENKQIQFMLYKLFIQDYNNIYCGTNSGFKLSILDTMI